MEYSNVNSSQFSFNSSGYLNPSSRLFRDINESLNPLNTNSNVGSNLEDIFGIYNETTTWNFETTFEFIIHGILINVIGLIGLIGNIVAIGVLSRPQMKSSITTILIGLVSCDSLVIITSIFMFSFTVFRHTGTYIFTYYYLHVYPYAVSVVYPIALCCQTGSAYLTLAVTLERYVAVCWSLKARHLLTQGRARASVALFLTFAIAYNIPRFFELTWESVSYDDITPEEFDVALIPGENVTRVRPTDMRMNYYYISIYVTWMYLVFMYIIPFSCLAIFNLLISLAIRRASVQRAMLTTQEKKDHNLASMFLVVVMVFFMCNSLSLIVNILEVVELPIMPLIQVSNLLVTVNSSVNFFVYCTFGQKFRTVFMQMFCGQKPRVQAVTAFRSNANNKAISPKTIQTTSDFLSVENSQLNDNRKSSVNYSDDLVATLKANSTLNIPLSSVTSACKAKDNPSSFEVSSKRHTVIETKYSKQDNSHSNHLATNCVFTKQLDHNNKCDNSGVKHIQSITASSMDHSIATKLPEVKSTCNHKHHHHHRSHAKNCKHSKVRKSTEENENLLQYTNDNGCHFDQGIPSSVQYSKGERRESSNNGTETAITEKKNKICREAVTPVCCAEQRAITNTQPNIQSLVLTNLSHSDKQCKQIGNCANGRIKSNPTIKISLLDTDDNTPELKPAKCYTKSKHKKNLDPIVIVATTPETTFYSEEEALPNKSSHVPETSETSLSKEPKGSITFTDQFKRHYI